ncbi:hypothetical protein Tco_1338950 [Tanacetum coccineum]
MNFERVSYHALGEELALAHKDSLQTIDVSRIFPGLQSLQGLEPAVFYHGHFEVPLGREDSPTCYPQEMIFGSSTSEMIWRVVNLDGFCCINNSQMMIVPTWNFPVQQGYYRKMNIGCDDGIAPSLTVASLRQLNIGPTLLGAYTQQKSQKSAFGLNFQDFRIIWQDAQSTKYSESVKIQWLQLMPIETLGAFENITLYVQLPPVYGLTSFQQLVLFEEFRNRLLM